MKISDLQRVLANIFSETLDPKGKTSFVAEEIEQLRKKIEDKDWRGVSITSDALMVMFPEKVAEKMRQAGNQGFADAFHKAVVEANTEANWASGFGAGCAGGPDQAKCHVCGEVH